MNDYIVLDGFRYATPETWKPQTVRPCTARITLAGSLEGTFGVGVVLRWEGQIRARPTPLGEYGSIDDLRATLRKHAAIPFTDHYGNEYSVLILGPFDEQSLVRVWDAATNKFHVQVQLMTVANAQ